MNEATSQFHAYIEIFHDFTVVAEKIEHLFLVEAAWLTQRLEG